MIIIINTYSLFPNDFKSINPKGHLICLFWDLNRTTSNKKEEVNKNVSEVKIGSSLPISNLPALIRAVEELSKQKESTVKRDSKERVLFKDKKGYYIM